MSSSEESIVSIEFDTEDIETKIEGIEKLLEELVSCAKNFSGGLSNALKPVLTVLGAIDSKMLSITNYLSTIPTMVETVSKEVQNGELSELLQGGFSTGIDIVLTIIGSEKAMGWITAAASKIGAMFKSGGLVYEAVKGLGAALGGLSVSATAVLIAVVAAVVAALIAIVVYWDEIVIFFTQTLPAALAPIGQWIRDSIITPFLESPVADWLYTNVLQPVIEAFTPIAGYIYNVLIVPLIQSFKDSWNEMQQELADLVTWVDEKLIQPIVGFVKAALEWLLPMLEGVWQFISDGIYNIVSFIATGIQMIFAVCATIGTWIYLNVIEPVAGFFEDLWTDVSNWAAEKWEKIQEILAPFVEWVTENVIDPFTEGFMDMVNGVIKFINGMLDGIVGGVNGIIRAINRLQFTVPDWVPEFGGQTFGFKLKELTAPQIPYLAKGAVLPANRPFLAVVGDQRHGTNVEAPLATIQEAVGLVMNDHISAMMAGFRALLEEQQATRRTIEGIEIGDRVIGEAAQRYQRKMAVTYGTF